MLLLDLIVIEAVRTKQNLLQNRLCCALAGELGCTEIAEVFLQVADDDGTVVQAECPGLCPLIEPPKVYGTGIYAGVGFGCLNKE